MGAPDSRGLRGALGGTGLGRYVHDLSFPKANEGSDRRRWKRVHGQHHRTNDKSHFFVVSGVHPIEDALESRKVERI